MKFINEALIIVGIAVVSILATIPNDTKPTPSAALYAVERDGKWLDYYVGKSNGAQYLKVMWSESPKGAFRYGTWDSAADDAKEWGGNVVLAPIIPERRNDN